MKQPIRCGGVRGLLIAAAAVLSGCAAPGARQPLPMQSAPAFSRTGTPTLESRWWSSFDDPRLDERIDHALAGNYTLMAAWERLREARAVVRRERSALYPRIDGIASGEVREGDVEDSSEVVLGVAASYEADLWGRIRSAVEAERLRAAATESDYQAAAIILSAAVALVWYQLAESQRHLELIESQLKTNQTVLKVLAERFGVGQTGAADVLRQRQLVESTREQMIVARARIEVFENQLAVLEGRPHTGAATSEPA